MFTIQAIQILIFLIPGLLASMTMDTFTFRSQKSTLGFLCEALILTLPIYIIYSAVTDVEPLSWGSTDVGLHYSFEPERLLLLAGISVIVGTVVSLCINYDLHMRCARVLRITKRTARNSVWVDVFQEKSNYIIINFADGTRLYGWPEYYTDDPAHPFIYMHDPAWIIVKDAEGDTTEEVYSELDIDGILITPEKQIGSIEFMKKGRHNDGKEEEEI